MSFGRLCSTVLPTLGGNFTMHVLPERIAMGKRQNREVVGLLEHAVLTTPDFNPLLPTKIHVIDENVVDDLFVDVPPAGRLYKLMEMLKQRKNEILVVVRSVDTQGMLALKKAAPQPRRMAVASHNQVVSVIAEQLGLKAITDVVLPQRGISTVSSVPDSVLTRYGKFTVKAMDVAERMVMPALAWHAIFPNAGDALAEGQQPIVIVPKKHIALIREPLSKDGSLPLVRVHSSCFTSMCGAKNCDCGQQFDQALKTIATFGGIMLHHDAEGRGAGLALKTLMNNFKTHGFSTYKAMHVFGFKDDERDYSPAAKMIGELIEGPITLITNNEDKLNALVDLGANIADTAEIIAQQIYPEMNGYLIAKSGRSHRAYQPIVQAKPEVQ